MKRSPRKWFSFRFYTRHSARPAWGPIVVARVPVPCWAALLPEPLVRLQKRRKSFSGPVDRRIYSEMREQFPAPGIGQRLRARRESSLVKTTTAEWMGDNARRRFASSALRTALSLAPLTEVLLPVAALFSRRAAARNRLVSGMAHLPERLPLPAPALQACDCAVSFLVTSLLSGFIFRLPPDARLSVSDVAPGAVVTPALFSAGKLLIGIYPGRAPWAPLTAAGSQRARALWRRSGRTWRPWSRVRCPSKRWRAERDSHGLHCSRNFRSDDRRRGRHSGTGKRRNLPQ